MSWVGGVPRLMADAGDVKLESHRHVARAEDARFMLEMGETFERTAQRLGITVKALEKLLSRRK